MRKYLPALSLILIAPLVAEVLPGSAPITHLRVLPFIVLIYGPGALLIRDVIKVRSLGWTSIVLLGAAYGILEEGIALQSLFNPALYNAASWGRVGSVNVVYAEAVIPIHAIWSALVPILLTDLLFPALHRAPYCGRLGRVLTGLWYLLGLLLLSLLTRLSIAPGYRADPVLIGLSAVLALALIIVALRVPSSPQKPFKAENPPGPWRILLLSAGIALLWHFLLAGLWRLRPEFAFWPFMLAPMLISALLLLAGYRYSRQWIAMEGWTDEHWFSLATGLVIAHSLFGNIIFTNSLRSRIATLAFGAAFLVVLYAQRSRISTGSIARVPAFSPAYRPRGETAAVSHVLQCVLPDKQHRR